MSGIVVAEGVVEITGDASAVPGDLSRSIDGSLPGLNAAGGRAGSGFMAGFKGFILGGVLVGLLSGIAGQVGDAISTGLSYAVQSIDLASDLAETRAAIGEIFVGMGEDFDLWSKHAVSDLGQTQQQALDAAKTFGGLGTAAGLAGSDLFNFSTGLVGLATDLASFNNTTVDEAILALGSGLRGEAEPLRRYNILLDDASIKAKALSEGIWDGEGALTAQQKTLAISRLVYEQAGVALGDFDRTSGGLANQQKILSAAWEEAQTKLGTALLPAVTQIVTFLNDNFMPIWNDVIEKVGPKLGEALEGITPDLIDLAETFADMLPDLIDLGIEVLPTVVDVIKIIAPLVKDWAVNTASLFEFISDLIDFLSGETTLQEFTEKIMKADGSIFEIARNIGSFIGDAIRNFAQFSLRVGTHITEFIDGIISIPGKVSGALSGAATWLVQTGKDIIQGLINGVAGMINKAVRAVTDVGGAMLGGIRDFLGIRSPSLRFDLEVGAPSGQGVLRGWKRVIGAWREGIEDDFRVPALPDIYAPRIRPNEDDAAPGFFDAAARLVARDGGGYHIEIGSIVIPADTIDDFVRIIELIKALPQVARQGKASTS